MKAISDTSIPNRPCIICTETESSHFGGRSLVKTSCSKRHQSHLKCIYQSLTGQAKIHPDKRRCNVCSEFAMPLLRNEQNLVVDACQQGDPEALEIMLKLNPNIHSESYNGENLSTIAAKNGHIDCINVLTKAGAVVDVGLIKCLDPVTANEILYEKTSQLLADNQNLMGNIKSDPASRGNAQNSQNCIQNIDSIIRIMKEELACMIAEQKQAVKIKTLKEKLKRDNENSIIAELADIATNCKALFFAEIEKEIDVIVKEFGKNAPNRWIYKNIRPATGATTGGLSLGGLAGGGVAVVLGLHIVAPIVVAGGILGGIATAVGLLKFGKEKDGKNKELHSYNQNQKNIENCKGKLIKSGVQEVKLLFPNAEIYEQAGVDFFKRSFLSVCKLKVDDLVMQQLEKSKDEMEKNKDILPIGSVSYDAVYKEYCCSADNELEQVLNKVISDMLFFQLDGCWVLTTKNLTDTYDKTFNEIYFVIKGYVDKFIREIIDPMKNESAESIKIIETRQKERQREIDDIALRLQKIHEMNEKFSQNVTKTAQLKEVIEWQKNRQFSQGGEH